MCGQLEGEGRHHCGGGHCVHTRTAPPTLH